MNIQGHLTCDQVGSDLEGTRRVLKEVAVRARHRGETVFVAERYLDLLSKKAILATWSF